MKIGALKDREYWRPSEAALVLGRGSEFWVRAFDAAEVAGYRDGKAQGRYIEAASARALLAGMVVAAAGPAPLNLREANRLWRERQALGL